MVSVNQLLRPLCSLSSTSSLGDWGQAKVDWRGRKKQERNYKQSYPVFKPIYYMQ